MDILGEIRPSEKEKIEKGFLEWCAQEKDRKGYASLKPVESKLFYVAEKMDDHVNKNIFRAYMFPLPNGTGGYNFSINDQLVLQRYESRLSQDTDPDPIQVKEVRQDPSSGRPSAYIDFPPVELSTEYAMGDAEGGWIMVTLSFPVPKNILSVNFRYSPSGRQLNALDFFGIGKNTDGKWDRNDVGVAAEFGDIADGGEQTAELNDLRVKFGKNDRGQRFFADVFYEGQNWGRITGPCSQNIKLLKSHLVRGETLASPLSTSVKSLFMDRTWRAADIPKLTGIKLDPPVKDSQ